MNKIVFLRKTSKLIINQINFIMKHDKLCEKMEQKNLKLFNSISLNLNYKDLIIFLIPCIIFLYYLYIFDPGILRYDSYNQLNQIATNSYNNWHPFFHTFIYQIWLKIYPDIKILSIIQILIFSTIWMVICKYYRPNDLNSNKIFIDQEIFKYLLEQPIRKIDLNSKDMELKKYDVVNIIKNEVISVERPADYKANIVKPVFVKVQEADSISLHRSVIENIVINLDKYKNKVDAFILKVGDANYYEIGRINTGVVFKIVGTSLPENDGLYYVLNSDGELVTTGKYTIV